MDGSIEQTLPSALRDLPVAWVLLDVRDETRVEDGFAVMPGVKSAVEIEMRAVNIQIRQSGHPLQGVQCLWKEYGIGLIHRRYRKRSQHEAVIVHDRDDLLTPLTGIRASSERQPTSTPRRKWRLGWSVLARVEF